MYFLFYSTSTNIESQDSNSRIALYNLQKLGKNDSVLPIFNIKRLRQGLICIKVQNILKA